MYNPNEDKRENDNNIEPIHGHGENEREEDVYKRQILDDSLGKIAADFLWAYPPGIPLVAPGERISEEVLAQAFYMKENGVNVQCAFAKDGKIRVCFCE